MTISSRWGWVGVFALAAVAQWPKVAVAADPAQIASTVCVACHGEGGHSLVPIFPKLAGQQPVYLAKQLTEFISGKRKNDAMVPILPSIKEDDIPGLAAYFASQKPMFGTVADAELAAQGKKLFEEGNEVSGVPACVGCHQPGALGNERYPRLAGQHKDYEVKQINSFKAGERTNDKGRVMRAVAERLTEQEIAAVTEYISSLDSKQ
jgi:cytochrome c553